MVGEAVLEPLASWAPDASGGFRVEEVAVPTTDPESRLLPEQVDEVVASACFPDQPEGLLPGRVGLEVEWFPLVADGGPIRRVLLAAGRPASLALLDELSRSHPEVGDRREVRDVPAYPLARGGRLTFEPGGQLEHATAPHRTLAAALEEVEAVAVATSAAYHAAGAVLASGGLDSWSDPGAVPQQLECFRYPAMERFFATRGGDGPKMMRHTCSLQVTVDLGPRGQRAERWVLANLISPLLTATFAASPAGDQTCERAAIWQRLDPTRTGFPALLVRGSGDPVAQIAEAALDADVMLVRLGGRDAWPGIRGWTFADWMAEGRPEHGWPTADDLAYHLSTLFHEVRPRGALELRGIDAVPARWRAVPCVLVVGALEDDRARDQLLALLESERSRLPELWRRAAGRGVGDPAFCALAVETWSFALAGAGRLPPGYVPVGGLAAVESYLERFTLRGRCPADELRAERAQNPDRGLAWAAEPVPEHLGSTR